MYWKRLLWTAAVATLLAAAAGAAGRAVTLLRRPAAGTETRYALATVARGDLTVTVSGTGTAAFLNRRPLYPDTDGEVAAVLVHPGDRVRAGQVLLTLSSDTLVAARQVTAPAAGRVAAVRVKEGEVVQPGAVLAEVVDARTVDFVAQVLEGEQVHVRPGQPAEVAVEGFDGTLAGTVREVGRQPVAAQQSIFYPVIISLPNPGLLAEGMPGRASIATGSGIITRGGAVRWRNRQPVIAPAAGRVEELSVAAGQEVAAGDPVARLVHPTLSPAEVRARLTLTSPVDGVVVAVNVSPGDRLTAGRTQDGMPPVVVAGSALAVTVALDEMDVARVRPGQPARVTFPALDDLEVTGTVERVALEGRSQGGVTTYDVRISLPPTPGVPAGMSATATITVAQKRGVLTVPAEAVVNTAAGPTVRVLAGGQVRQVPVRLGLRSQEAVEVLAGLEEGQQVVLAAAAGQNTSPQPRPFMGPGLFGPPAGGFRGGGGPR